MMDRKLEEVEWLLSYARNANRLIRVAPAITTKKVNAPRRLTPMRSLNPVRHPQKMKSAHTPEINPKPEITRYLSDSQRGRANEWSGDLSTV
jgi:hypothetical protein